MHRVEEARSVLPQSIAFIDLHARLLATCPDPELRNGKLALGLTRASLAKRQNMEKFQTIAMALAEVGNFQEAVRFQEKILETARQRAHLAHLITKLEEGPEPLSSREGESYSVAGRAPAALAAAAHAGVELVFGLGGRGKESARESLAVAVHQ